MRNCSAPCTDSFLPDEPQAYKLARDFGIVGNETIPGIVTHILEAGGAGSEAVSRMVGDPGGASYGKYQFSSRKGSLAEFVNFCIASPKYSELGSTLKESGGLDHKGIPKSFDTVDNSSKQLAQQGVPQSSPF